MTNTILALIGSAAIAIGLWPRKKFPLIGVKLTALSTPFILCPDCRYMFDYKDNYLVCNSPGCKYRGVRFKIPVVELIRDTSDS